VFLAFRSHDVKFVAKTRDKVPVLGKGSKKVMEIICIKMCIFLYCALSSKYSKADFCSRALCVRITFTRL